MSANKLQSEKHFDENVGKKITKQVFYRNCLSWRQNET